ncbi:hypothetical protein K458DRAFT_16246 [Lentithecium fluviatile CBS 122367]|uniref:Uncharacterized protein n=1 Tax=Lentithecium fluviatile CBS 122367 TaxID=1168545 RepID=A0A6G1J642_9PLEO|nr:hypothetical protein K458DRAFT_16246 [Lentithecium fluviatile CBS 122367]
MSSKCCGSFPEGGFGRRIANFHCGSRIQHKQRFCHAAVKLRILDRWSDKLRGNGERAAGGAEFFRVSWDKMKRSPAVGRGARGVSNARCPHHMFVGAYSLPVAMVDSRGCYSSTRMIKGGGRVLVNAMSSLGFFLSFLLLANPVVGSDLGSNHQQLALS